MLKRQTRPRATALLSNELTRVCHPAPLARNASKTSASTFTSLTLCPPDARSGADGGFKSHVGATRWGMAKVCHTFMELQALYFKLGGKPL